VLRGPSRLNKAVFRKCPLARARSLIPGLGHPQRFSLQAGDLSFWIKFLEPPNTGRCRRILNQSVFYVPWLQTDSSTCRRLPRSFAFLVQHRPGAGDSFMTFFSFNDSFSRPEPLCPRSFSSSWRFLPLQEFFLFESAAPDSCFRPLPP